MEYEFHTQWFSNMNYLSRLLLILILNSAWATQDDRETLYLSVYVNHVKKIELVQLERVSHDFFINQQWLSKLDLKISKQVEEESINICGIPGIQCVYDKKLQSLLLMAEIPLLPTYTLSGKVSEQPTYNKHFGALLNYNTSLTKFNNLPVSLDILQQWRMFTPSGSFETTGNYHAVFGSQTEESLEGLVRYDSHFTQYDERNQRVVRIGDFVSSGGTWSRQYRMGGLRIATDFSLQPNFIAYPTPEIIGSSILPSSVELYINNSRQFIGSAQPGSFQIEYAPTTTGLSTATIQTQDARGRYTEQSLQFYVATNLLKPGVSDYDLNLGYLREEYGRTSFDYDSSLMTVGNLRYGLNNNITGNFHYELSGRLKNLGLGVDLKLGNYGILSPAVAYGNAGNKQGFLSSIAYSYQARRWGLSTRWISRERQYQDIGTLNEARLSKREAQISTAYALDNGTALSVNYFDYEVFDEPATRVVNLGFSKSHTQASMSASISYSIEPESAWNVNFTFSMPLGRRSRGGIRSFDGSDSSSQSYLSFNTVSEQPNFWNVSGLLSLNQKNYAARANIRTNNNEWTVSGFQRENSSGMFGDVSGSLVLFDNQLYSGERIADTFAIVSTDGIKDVPVYVENQRLGQTNDNGFFLITGVPAYNTMRVSIGTQGLPLNSQIDKPTKSFSGARGNAALVNFKINTVRSALAVLVDEQGNYLPVGQEVQLNNGAFNTSIGWDGEVYLENVKSNNVLTVSFDDRTCEITFDYETKTNQIPTIGPLICKLEAAQ